MNITKYLRPEIFEMYIGKDHIRLITSYIMKLSFEIICFIECKHRLQNKTPLL